MLNEERSDICELLRSEILRRCLDRPDTLRGKKGLDLLWSAISSGCSELLTLLKETGCNLNAPHVMERTALMHAVEMNQPDCVRKLLELGAEPQAGDYPPAKLAITLGDEEIAILLLEEIPSQNDSQREEFFYEALYKGRERVARYFLDRGYPPNRPGTWDITPLLAAVMGGSRKVVEALVAAGADVNLPGSGGVTPLMKAIEFGQNDIAKWLLDHGADPAYTSPQGASALTMLSSSLSSEDVELARRLIDGTHERSERLELTPLMAAAAGRKPATLSLLLEHPQDLEHRDLFGQTALHHACQSGDVGCIRLLVERGADCNARTHSGDTPLTLLLKNNSRCDSALEALIEHGADPVLRGGDGLLPSQLAAAAGEPELVEILTHSSPDASCGGSIPGVVFAQAAEVVRAVRQGDGQGATAALNSPLLTPADLVRSIESGLVPVMFEAVRCGMLDVVRHLLDGGAPVGMMDGDRNTPLAMAARYSRLEIARLLLERGANLEAMTERGVTPIQLAVTEEMERLLFSHGARPKT